MGSIFILIDQVTVNASWAHKSVGFLFLMQMKERGGITKL